MCIAVVHIASFLPGWAQKDEFGAQLLPSELDAEGRQQPLEHSLLNAQLFEQATMAGAELLFCTHARQRRGYSQSPHVITSLELASLVSVSPGEEHATKRHDQITTNIDRLSGNLINVTIASSHRHCQRTARLSK